METGIDNRRERKGRSSFIFISPSPEYSFSSGGRHSTSSRTYTILPGTFMPYSTICSTISKLIYALLIYSHTWSSDAGLRKGTNVFHLDLDSTESSKLIRRTLSIISTLICPNVLLMLVSHASVSFPPSLSSLSVLAATTLNPPTHSNCFPVSPLCFTIIISLSAPSLPLSRFPPHRTLFPPTSPLWRGLISAIKQEGATDAVAMVMNTGNEGTGGEEWKEGGTK